MPGINNDYPVSSYGAIIANYQQRYTITLTEHQAAMVFKFEQEEAISLTDNFPSEWEQHDFRLEAMSRILRQDQMEQYRSVSAMDLAAAEKSMVEDDKAQLQQVRYHQEILDFQKSIHKEIFSNKLLFSGFQHPDYKGKVGFLKAEYERFLARSHKRAVVNHFRYQRQLKPNSLEVLRLRNKIRHIEPDCGYFYHQIDAPTKAVADFLVKELKHLPSLNSGTYQLLQNKIYEFYEELNARHFKGGVFSHVRYQPQQERPVESWTMYLILLDEEKYGLDLKW